MKELFPTPAPNIANEHGWRWQLNWLNDFNQPSVMRDANYSFLEAEAEALIQEGYKLVHVKPIQGAYH